MTTNGQGILAVDDEPAILWILTRIMDRAGYTIATATDADAAREHLRSGTFGAMLCDVTMPGDSGLDLVEECAKQHPDMAIVMVSGIDDPSLAMRALELGASGYIVKPFEPNEILITVGGALRRAALERENRMVNERLEWLVAERTEHLEATIERLAETEAELRLSHEDAIRRLTFAAEFRDPHPSQHPERASRYAALLAARAGFDDDRAEMVRVAALMHDIGKIGLPDALLTSTTSLTAQQRVQMNEHPEMGFRILGGSSSDLLRLAASIALTHHERWDGTGYPRGLAGEAIPIEGRIMAVADVYDALTSERPYKDAFTPDHALAMVRAESGAHFDPGLLELFVAARDDLVAIAATYPDPPAENAGPPPGPTSAVRAPGSLGANRGSRARFGYTGKK